MDNTTIILEKIDNVFNLMNNEQEIPTDDILEISGILLSYTESTLPEFPDQSKHKLLTIIKKNLQTANTELQKNTLTLLCYSFDLNFFTKDLIVPEILMIIIDGAFKKKVENLEDQELWLKALDTLLKFTESELTPFIIKHSIELLEAIQLALTSKVINSPKKLKALKLLNEIIAKVTLDDASRTLLLSILFTILIPTIFSDDCRHFKHTLDVANKIVNKVPYHERVLYPKWAEFKEIFISTYGPFMIKMIVDEKSTYGDLVKFSLKILHSEIHGSSSPLIINSILGTLEVAFKAKNMNLRKEAFLCWQEFIKSFLLTGKERIPTRKINLLTVPLKTNNGYTNELILCKYQTWCILLNTIHKLNIFPKEFSMMLQNFLHFSFGPLGETPLLSYTLKAVSPGKRIPKLHMEMCQNFFKIIAGTNLMEKYSVENMEIVCDSPMLTVPLFIKMSRTIIYSVGEASILLSNCTDKEDDAKKLNNLLWQALFDLCQNSTVHNENLTILGELNVLITNIVEVSKTRPKLSIFCIEVILSLMLLEKYSFCKIIFEEKNLFEHLLSTLFKDIKYFYSQSNTPTLFDLISKRKRSEASFTTFISKTIGQLSDPILTNTEDRVIINNLFEIWGVLEKVVFEEIFQDEDQPLSFIANYKSLMIWCIVNISLSNEPNKIIDIWKKSLKDYSSKLGEKYYTINSLCNVFASKILSLPINELSAEFLQGIISCLCFKKGREVDYKKELVIVLSILNEIILKKDLPTNVVSLLKNCVEIVFKNITIMGTIARILPSLTELVISFNHTYPEVCLADTIIPYFRNYKLTERTKLIIEGMFKTLQNSNNDKYKEFYEEFKKRISEQATEINENVEPDFKKKGDKTIIDGIDINTMTPVKVKGSLLNIADSKNQSEQKPQENVLQRIKKPPNLPMNEDFIYVNTPYNFNPKKLTKSQKEKFRRKNDDIPAMYNDLSQSQTMELSNTSSNFENIISSSQKSVDNNFIVNIAQSENQEKGAFSEINDKKVFNLKVDKKPDEINYEDKNISPKSNTGNKPVTKRELIKIKMDNIMGFEEYLQENISSSRPYTRKRQIKTDINESPTPKKEELSTPGSQKKRGRKRKEHKEQNSEKHAKKEAKTSEVIESSQILSQDTVKNSEKEKTKREINLEDLGIKKLDTVTSETPKPNDQVQYESVINNLKECRVNIEATKITRRNSLDSCDISPTQSDDNIKKHNRDRKKTRRNSLKEEILTEETEKVVPKLKLLRSPLESKEFLIEKPSENIEENEKDTESVPSEIFSEEITITDYPNADQSICRKVLFDKNDDSDVTDIDNSKETCDEPVIAIVSSPIRHDTPTRNEELLESTLEISPIKSPAQKNLKNIPSNDKSPELFSENTNKEELIAECSTPVIPKKNSRKGKFVLQSRGAQMMNLIVPKGCQNVEEIPDNNSTIVKNDQKIATPSLTLNSSSRIGKMMVQFDVKSSERVDERFETPSKSTGGEEDFLHFRKNLPLPSASPRFGILRKRKRPDDLEEGMSPCAKKKRVNFNDPPLSSIKLIEKYQYIRNRSSTVLFGQATDSNSDISETPSSSEEEHTYNKQKVMQFDSVDTHTLNVLEIACPETQVEEPVEINGITDNTEYFDMYKKNKIKKVALVSDEISFIIGTKGNAAANNSQTSKDNYEIDSDSPRSPEENMEIEISPTQSQNEPDTIPTSVSNSDATDIDLESYNRLKSCTVLLTDCLKDNKEKNQLIEALTEDNVKTMGDFANLVIKNPHLLVELHQIKNILDNHNCDDHQPKKRKIIPITLSSPLSKKSNKVSVISSPQEKHSDDVFGGSSQSEPTAHNRNVTESQLSCNWISPISRNAQSFNIPLSGPQKNLVSQINNMSTESSSSSTNSLNWNQLFCNDIGVDKVTKLLLLEETTRENNIVSMVRVIASYNAPKLFETILGLIMSSEKISSVFRSSFIPNILKNPETTCCIANNLSLLELQEHLVERLTRDHENKETFLKRLNTQLGNKMIIKLSNDSSVADSQTKTNSVEAIFEQIKSLNVTDNDLDTLCEMTTFLQNLIHKKIKNLVKKNSS